MSAETIGGGVNLDNVEEDKEFTTLASMSVEDIEALLDKAGEEPAEAELSTPEGQSQQPRTTEELLAESVSGGQAEDKPQSEDDRLAGEIDKLLLNKTAKKEPANEQAAEAQKQTTVPHQALHAARQQGQAAKEQAKTLEQELEEARQREAYWRGHAEALKANPRPDQANVVPAQQERTTGHVDAEIKSKYDAKEEALDKLAESYDNAEFGLREYNQKKKAIEQEYNNTVLPLVSERNKLLTQSTHSRVSPEDINSDPWLQQNTDALRQQHPWLDDESISEPLWAALQDAAKRIMEQKGQVIEPTPQSTWLLRRTIAEVGEQWKIGEIASRTPAAPGTEQNQLHATPNAADRLGKLDLAHRHPPNTSRSGAPSVNDDTPSRVEGSSSAELVSQLSKAEIENLLGVS